MESNKIILTSRTLRSSISAFHKKIQDQKEQKRLHSVCHFGTLKVNNSTFQETQSIKNE